MVSVILPTPMAAVVTLTQKNSRVEKFLKEKGVKVQYLDDVAAGKILFFDRAELK